MPDPQQAAVGAVNRVRLFAIIGATLLAVSGPALAAEDGFHTPRQAGAVGTEVRESLASDPASAVAGFQPPHAGRMRQGRDNEARQPAELPGPKLVEVLPLTDRVLMLHFDEGHVVHHQRGMSRSDERVVAGPLDTTAAARPASYRITSSDDPAYARPRSPESVGRKSKGTDFAWFVDRWENGHAVNTRPDHAKEHWLYLQLPSPMVRGKTYTVDIGGLASNGRKWDLRFDEASVRSEAVHVNLLGYVPTATQKFAYVYHWKGDRGGLDLRDYAGRPFRLIDQATGRPAFTGKLVFRAHRASRRRFTRATRRPTATS